MSFSVFCYLYSHLYFIDYESDPKRNFVINRLTGVVTIHTPLDFETATQHSVTILAIDSGKNPKVICS